MSYKEKTRIKAAYDASEKGQVPKDTAAFKAHLRRIGEVRLLRRTMLVKRPKADAIADVEAFEIAVDCALGSDVGRFEKLIANATPAQLDAVAAGFQAVAESKRGKMSLPQARVAVLLSSKLEAEQGMEAGQLPTQRTVRKRAVELLGKWFPDAGFPTRSDVATWRHAFKKAELEYLPSDTRGAGKKGAKNS